MNLSVLINSSDSELADQTIWDSYAVPIDYGVEHMKGEWTEEPINLKASDEEVVQTHLSEIGLPFQLEKFISGNGYDLLFLKNHGIIIKVGWDHDPIDLIHPCFSQPLWWVTDKKSGINTCVYAGEKLMNETPFVTEIQFKSIIQRSGQYPTDVVKRNIGFAENIPILIDVDAVNNYTWCADIRELKQKLARKWLNHSDINQAEITRRILFEIYGNDKTLQPWMKKIDRHQPLRHMFWDVQNLQGSEKEDGLRRLWASVADWTQNPRLNGTQLHRDYLIPPAA